MGAACAQNNIMQKVWNSLGSFPDIRRGKGRYRRDNELNMKETA